jgi:hypothetical protein
LKISVDIAGLDLAPLKLQSHYKKTRQVIDIMTMTPNQVIFYCQLAYGGRDDGQKRIDGSVESIAAAACSHNEKRGAKGLLPVIAAELAAVIAKGQ